MPRSIRSRRQTLPAQTAGLLAVSCIAWLGGWGECFIGELQRLADNVEQLVIEQKLKMAAALEVRLGEALEPRRPAEIKGAALLAITDDLLWGEHDHLRRAEPNVAQRAVCVVILDREKRRATIVPKRALQLRSTAFEVKLVGSDLTAHE